MTEVQPNNITSSEATIASGSVPHVIPPQQAADATPTIPGSEVAPSAPSLADIIPEEYKEKGYMSKIQDIEGLFKSFDGMQSLIGKRPSGIPQENATQEQWNQFYKELGRPDTAEGYEVKLPEQLPEGIAINEDNISEFKSLAHELGLTPPQVQKILDFDIKRQEANLNNIQDQSKDQEAKLNEDFNKLAKETFGDKLDQVIDTGKSLIAKYANNNELSKMVQDLDNSSLIILSSVLDGIAKDYIGEDQISTKDSFAASSHSDTLAEAKKLMTSEAYRNPFDPNHEYIKEKVNNAYKKIYG